MKHLVRITLLFTFVLACSSLGLAQDKPKTISNAITVDSKSDTRIPRNSRIYIAPMDGFETYLAAAFRNKGVPVLIVTDRDEADFEITDTHEKKNAGWAKTIFLGDGRSSASASMQVVNLKTKVVVYADSLHRGSANRGERSIFGKTTTVYTHVRPGDSSARYLTL